MENTSFGNLPSPQPDPQPSPQPQPTVSPTPHKRKKRRWPIVFLVLLLIAAAGAGGYLYAERRNNQKRATDAVQNNAPPETTPQPSDQPTIVNSVSYPFDLQAKQKFTIGLAVPHDVEAVSIRSNNNNRGPEQFFTDKYNDELGRWVIGFPKSDGSAHSEISVLAISKSWLAAAQQESYDQPNPDYSTRTPAEKQAFLNKLKARTQECVKDAKKGFQTADKKLSICYTLNPGVDAYSPQIILEGYGEVEGQPLLLVGNIHIEDGLTFANADEERKVLADAKQTGVYPKESTAVIDQFLKALPQTQITTAPNNPQ